MVVPVTWSGPNTTGAWVNYSLAGVTAGTIQIADAAGDVLVGPVSLAPASSLGNGPAVPSFSLVVLALAGSVGLGSTAVSRRRRPVVLSSPPSEEEAARRLAEGRAEVVEAVRRAGHADRAEIARSWEPDPPPELLDEWLASLVADGTLVVAAGAEEAPEYALAPPLPEAPRVTVDADALERAVAAREEAVRPDGEGER